jgi:hypothetical protein
MTVITAETATRLTTRRLHLMRAGYLFMGLGLAVVKWPLLGGASTMPLYEGVTLATLTAMSVLALLGLRHPVRMLPVLLFEVLWKALWLSLVALPKALGDGLDAATTDVLVNCSLVVVIVAVVPWRYTWERYGLGAPAGRLPRPRLSGDRPN